MSGGRTNRDWKAGSSIGDSALSDLEAQVNAEALGALEKSLEETLAALQVKLQKRREMYQRIYRTFDVADKIAMQRYDSLVDREKVVNDHMKEIIEQRDQALEDLRNVEHAFSDVHRKYERAKTSLLNIKQNEDLLRQRETEMQLLCLQRDQKFAAFKHEAQDTLEKIYLDYQDKLSSLEGEASVMNAKLRRAELRAGTLGQEVSHKARENTELNNLADELIGRASCKGNTTARF